MKTLCQILSQFLCGAHSREMNLFAAFHLEEGSRDAALLLWLEPGVYTAEVRGENENTGLVLVAIYAVP